MERSVLPYYTVYLHLFLPQIYLLGSDLLLELLIEVLAFHPFRIELSHLCLDLSLKPGHTLHVSLSCLKVPSDGLSFLVLLSVDELKLSHLILHLIILGSQFVFNQQL